eukprot:13170510-Alexandrium_andersonii.AAC.1
MFIEHLSFAVCLRRRAGHSTGEAAVPANNVVHKAGQSSTAWAFTRESTHKCLSFAVCLRRRAG